MSFLGLGALLVTTTAIAVAVAARAHARLRDALQRAGAAEREIASLGRRQAHTEHELDFLSRFVREFPRLTRTLHTTLRQREVPQLLLNVVTRTFEPRWTVVLRRHQTRLGDGRIVSRFIVAATSPEAPVKAGAEVKESTPELDRAVADQTLVSRREVPVGAMAPRPHAGAPGLDCDLVAPMVFGEETLGVIGLSQPARASEDAKAALRLIAQAGAQALYASAAYQQVKTSANLDGLTGIFNKSHMTQALGEMVVETARRQAALSVFLFDVDNFKHYNDANGHVEGDQLLKELARLVQEHVRQEDVFGRFGGEEFLLILPATPLAAGLAVAEKVRGLIASHPFSFRERQPLGRVSVSGGVAEYPAVARDSTHLLKAADEALYVAKRAGRNQVLPAEPRYLGGPPIESPEETAEG